MVVDCFPPFLYKPHPSPLFHSLSFISCWPSPSSLGFPSLFLGFLALLSLSKSCLASTVEGLKVGSPKRRPLGTLWGKALSFTSFFLYLCAVSCGYSLTGYFFDIFNIQICVVGVFRILNDHFYMLIKIVIHFWIHYGYIIALFP